MPRWKIYFCKALLFNTAPKIHKEELRTDDEKHKARNTLRTAQAFHKMVI